MKGWLLLLAIAGLLLAGGAAALPPPPPPPLPPLPICRQEPVSFCENESGAVSSNFHPRRDGNRVFYARSLKQARKGAFRFTSIGLPYNPVDVDFRKSGLLAVFYKGHSGFDPEAQAVEESAAGDLSATIRLECYNATLCATPASDPSYWGIYVVLVIDKGSLVAPVKTLHVTTTAWG